MAKKKNKTKREKSSKNKKSKVQNKSNPKKVVKKKTMSSNMSTKALAKAVAQKSNGVTTNLLHKIKNTYLFLQNKRIDIWKHKYNPDVKNYIAYPIILLILILFCILVFFIANPVCDKAKPRIKIPDVLKDISEFYKTCDYERKIDGVCVDSEEEMNISPIAVMVENHSISRPLAGITQANLIYEAMVEGPITRFMLVFANNQDIQKIGPIRSARPYYLTWAKEYDAMYTHVGGSPESLNLIPHYGIKNFDEFSKGGYFWRQKTRQAPHNVYSSSELLYKGYTDYFEQEEPKYEGWKFKDDYDQDTRGEDKQQVEIMYSNAIYDVMWQYNQEENTYIRYQQNDRENPYSDEEGNEIIVKNIIIQFTETKVIDDIGRLKIDTIGQGDAIILRDGEIYNDITWKKDDINSRTLYYTKDNKEFKFNRGTTWINIVPVGNNIKYNN